MTEYAAVTFAVVLTIAISIPLGRYIARVFTGQRTWLEPVLGPVERLVLRYLAERDSDAERFIDVVYRLGIEPFKEAVYGHAHQRPSHRQPVLA